MAKFEEKLTQNNFRIYNLTITATNSSSIIQVTNNNNDIIYEVFYTLNGSTLDNEGCYVSFEKFPGSAKTIYFSQDYSNVKNKTKSWYSKEKALDLNDDSSTDKDSSDTGACAISAGIDSSGFDRTYNDCSEVDEKKIDASIAKRFMTFQKANISDDEIFEYIEWYTKSGDLI